MLKFCLRQTGHSYCSDVNSHYHIASCMTIPGGCLGEISKLTLKNPAFLRMARNEDMQCRKLMDGWIDVWTLKKLEHLSSIKELMLYFRLSGADFTPEWL